MSAELDLDDVAAQSKKAAAELAELRESERSWIDTASFFYRGEEFFRGLVDECAKHLGEDVFVADDGSVSEEPLRLKVPDLVAKQAAEIAELRAELESLRNALFDMANGWSPIQTAPKDGTLVRLLCEHGEDTGKYCDYTNSGSSLTGIPGEWSTYSGNGEPTHWMPIVNKPDDLK